MAETTNNSHPSKRDNAWWNNRFYTVLISVALMGGGCAFLIPLFITSYGPGDNVPGLRQAFLAITGGTLAILTLWETRRKNDQEHMRQVHAERRTRYATAIEQLADEKAPIRLGGVYTLIKLVDEWLADEKTLPNEEKRREEGQVIVNSLCAYIRSPFDLASKAEVLSQDQTPENYEGGVQQFVKDQARFREEKELRLTILETIRSRLNGGITTQENSTKKPLKYPWSDFDYNFSNAIFFYPANFNNSLFGASSNFFGAKFAKYAGFSGAEFTSADFSEAEFTWYANFSEAEFTSADFSEAEFTWYANFSEAEFTSADFSEAEFTSADFSEAEFTGYANFSEAEFTSADFSWAEFIRNANFSGATFEEKPIFERALGDKTCKARFSCKADPEDYNFEVLPDSPYKIETEEKEYNETKFIIPKGTELFDPDEPSEQDNNGGN